MVVSNDTARKRLFRFISLKAKLLFLHLGTVVSNGTCTYSRGKALGGSSCTNAGIYTRGNALDFDVWEDLGNTGWSYDDVLPYFKKSETVRFSDPIDSDYHGFSGLQAIDMFMDTPNLVIFYLKIVNH